MSKNTGASKFRKVDVDQYDEDQYIDEEDEQLEEQGPNESEVTSLLAQYPFHQSTESSTSSYSLPYCNLAVTAC